MPRTYLWDRLPSRLFHPVHALVIDIDQECLERPGVRP